MHFPVGLLRGQVCTRVIRIALLISYLFIYALSLLQPSLQSLFVQYVFIILKMAASPDLTIMIGWRRFDISASLCDTDFDLSACCQLHTRRGRGMDGVIP